jgi:hypothetical protein
MKHKHRINPGHNGGDYTEGNVITVEVVECNTNTASHVMWHYANWLLCGKQEDKLAWRGLAGFLGKEEIIAERQRIIGRNNGLKNKGRKISDVHRDKLKQSHQGKKHSQETRNKMSQTRQGKPQPHLKKPRTTDVKQKISETLKGARKSPAHCQKLSEVNKGIHIGKSWWVNEENEVKFCHECPDSGWRKGRKWKG